MLAGAGSTRLRVRAGGGRQDQRVRGEEVATLIALEDLHWADAGTLAFVEYLADRLASTAVRCI